MNNLRGSIKYEVYIHNLVLHGRVYHKKYINHLIWPVRFVNCQNLPKLLTGKHILDFLITVILMSQKIKFILCLFLIKNKI